ncbi:MAG: peptidoglycan DD-metalloendopeptidase family protein [Paracoccaceae bacterium]
MILPQKAGWALMGVFSLTACAEPLDFDLRGQLGAFSTTNAARTATADRPQPDNRGVISYPNYQVAVAQRGDTIAQVAGRVGLPAADLASYNGVAADAPLREGEILALPNRVTEPSPSTGALGTGPIQPSSVDVTTLAGQAINNSPDTSTQVAAAGPITTPLPQTGDEPVQHRVERGETAFTIARLYNVPVRSLAEWNGLGSNFAVREGQFLLIPVAQTAPPQANQTPQQPENLVTAPGEGTQTPTPPSASRPLPVDDTDKVVAAPPAPDIGKTTKATRTAMSKPVDGTIIREYTKGRNEGIDIKGSPGGSVTAAADGTVAAITKSAEGVPIIVLRHPDNVLTVYANVDNVSVKKGDSVKRGKSIAKLRDGDQSFVHFEVRQGFDSVDPNSYLQ